MKNNLLILLTLLLSGLQLTAQSQIENKIDKQTFIYAVKGNDTLRLDKYDIPEITGDKPCIIFVFGGGFVNGERNNDFNSEYMKRLAQNGCVAIAIDYRLGMKNVKKKKIENPMEFVNMLENTINIAVEDLFDATSYVLSKAQEWNIDPEKIIANGSSAGAVTVLQGEYMICNKETLSKRLPGNFNYAGVIAFAGCIFSNNKDLKWLSKPSPIQMFHGDADSNVPYNKVEMFNLGMYGSKYIAGQLNEMQTPYYFHSVENAAHEIAGDPMIANLDEINSFINRFIIKKEPLIINTKVEQIGKPEMKKDFEIIDFIKSNYM